MKTYNQFATTLETLLASDAAVRIVSRGFMPLSVEEIGTSGDGLRLVAISHTAVQNGDLMRDPEMVFEFHGSKNSRAAEPISFRSDFVAIHQEVHAYDEGGHRTGVRPKLKNELRSFARTWFRNLKEQGFLEGDAEREVLA